MNAFQYANKLQQARKDFMGYMMTLTVYKTWRKTIDAPLLGFKNDDFREQFSNHAMLLETISEDEFNALESDYQKDNDDPEWREIEELYDKYAREANIEHAKKYGRAIDIWESENVE